MSTSGSAVTPRRTSKQTDVTVLFLDKSIHHFKINNRTLGQELFDLVIKTIQVIEADYFDLEFTNKEGIQCWLDHQKSIYKQTASTDCYTYHFGVKFYAPHPNLLTDEYTRYLFALQIKKNLYEDGMHCNENTNILLAAFIVQAELGDYKEEYGTTAYLSNLQLMKTMSPEFLQKVRDCHQTLLGQTSVEADYNLLDTVRKVDLYGIHIHSAKDHEGLSLNLGIAHMGIIVFQNTVKINTFSWAKIRKISFKRKKFLIKLHPEGYVALFVLWLVEGYYKDTVEFYFESRNECKNFWKQCIEHHAFFRCSKSETSKRQKSLLVTKGSSYRYCGRTQKQLDEFVKDARLTRPHFERSASTSRLMNRSNHSTLISQATPNCAHKYSHSSQGLANFLMSGFSTDSKSVAASEPPSRRSDQKSKRKGRSRNTSTSSGSHTMHCSSSREQLSNNANASPDLAASKREKFAKKTKSESHRNSLSLSQLQFAYSSSSCDGANNEDEMEESHIPEPLSTSECSAPQTNLRYHKNQNQTKFQSPLISSSALSTRPPAGSNQLEGSVVCHVSLDNQPSSVRHINGDFTESRYVEECDMQEPSSVSLPHSISPEVQVSEDPRIHQLTILPPDVSPDISDPSLTSSNLPMTTTSSGGSRPATLSQQSSSATNYSEEAVPSRHFIPNLSSSTSTVHPHEQWDMNEMAIVDPDSPLQTPTSVMELTKAFKTSCPAIGSSETNNLSNNLTPSSPASIANQNSFIFSPPLPSSQTNHISGSTLLTNSSNDHQNVTMLKDNEPYLAASHSVSKSEVPLMESDHHQQHRRSYPASVKTATLTGLSSVSGISSQSDHENEEFEPPKRDLALPPVSSFSESISDRTSHQSDTRNNELELMENKPTHSSSKSKRKKYPTDRAYYYAKELLMTERTYKKDLEVCCVWLRKFVCTSKQSDNFSCSLSLLFSLLDPIYEQHICIARCLDARLTMWERPSGPPSKSCPVVHRIGDIFLDNLKILHLYRRYLENMESILIGLERECRSNPQLEALLHQFQCQVVCYLPLNSYLMKPMQRLMHYRLLLERLIHHYPDDHPDHNDCRVVHAKLLDVILSYETQYNRLEQLYKLFDLQRELINLNPLLSSDSIYFHNNSQSIAESDSKEEEEDLGPLIAPHREFIREGVLHRCESRGYQPRMFFLLSDQLIYTSKITSTNLQFKVRGQYPLKEISTEVSTTCDPHTFILNTGSRKLPLAAPNDYQRDLWIQSIMKAKSHLAQSLLEQIDGDDRDSEPLSISRHIGSKSQSQCDNADDKSVHSQTSRCSSGAGLSSVTQDRQFYQLRTNTSVHVCWHRNLSISIEDIRKSNQQQLSGYLLRKFKSTDGWQKLWVIFTNFCLFFYKNCQDETPLATLPLLGYTISKCDTNSDRIEKPFAFKLQYKNHIYYFRCENVFIFERWFEVINSATSGALRTRLLPTRLM